jgi:histidine triad (HIT) family protein
MAYDLNNIFAKILRGEIPSFKIYEDADTLAFMDVMPQSDGHALVIPKAPSLGLDDAKSETAANLIQVVQKLAPKIRDAMGAGGYRLAQFNGADAGQTVFHLHFHIIPMYAGIALRPHTGKMGDQAAIKGHAEKIRKALTS